MKKDTAQARIWDIDTSTLPEKSSGGGDLTAAISNAQVGSIAPGEPDGYTATARATMPVKVIELDGKAFRALVTSAAPQA